MMARHIFAAVICTFAVGTATARPHTRPPVDDLFAPGCTLPFSAIQDHHTIAHQPCRHGSGSPERISVWEIHPIYAIDVCEHTTLSTCRIGTDSDWQSLADWVPSQ